ncbi:SOS response-associated peptidase family protein [Delftia lacustris]
MGNRYGSPDISDIDEIYPLRGPIPKKGWDVYITPLAFGPYIKTCGSLEVGQWGLIPQSSMSKRPLSSDGSPLSTEKACRETLSTDPVFGPSWQASLRCLIPVNSWIETYSGLSSRSISWMFRRADGKPAMLAGLYSEWTDPVSGETVPSYAMITQAAEAHPVLSLMHRPGRAKRSVVMLESCEWGAWLHGTPAQAESLIKLPAMGSLKSGAENPDEEALLPLDQLRALKSGV